MNLYEFIIFTFHLSSLSLMIYLIRLFERQQVLSLKDVEVSQSEEKFVEEDFEEPESEEEKEFDSSKEQFTMSENPILRHRNVETEAVSAMEMVD